MYVDVVLEITCTGVQMYIHMYKLDIHVYMYMCTYFLRMPWELLHVHGVKKSIMLLYLVTKIIYR